MDMGFPFGAINHALSLYGTRDIGTLAGILTGAVDAPVDLVVVDPDLAPDVFPLEDTPDWFVTRWVSTSIDHGNFDVESAKFSAANTWGLRRYLLAEGFDFNVAMKAAKESTTRAEALNMAHAYKAEVSETCHFAVVCHYLIMSVFVVHF